MLARLGASVCEADDIARGLLDPGRPAYRRVVREFGRGILAAGGEVDRAALARRVFGHPRRLARLNALTHPAVFRELRRRRRIAARADRPFVAVIPLLYETGTEAEWDAVICVTAPAAVAQRRLRGRGWAPAEIADRIAAQWSVKEKSRRADAVIRNGGTLSDLRRAVARVWKQWLAEETSEHGT